MRWWKVINPFLAFLSGFLPAASTLFRKRVVPVETVAKVEPVKLNLDDIKAGLKRILPVVKTIARLTPNPFDDAAVAFIEQLLADPAKLETVAAR